MEEEDYEKKWQVEISRLLKRINDHQNLKELIVFYGSSSIRLWEDLHWDIRPLNVLNLGFGGSNLYWCKFYFNKLFENIIPRKIVLYGGENDLSEGKSPEHVNDDLKELIGMARSRFPDSELILISLKPSPSRMHLIDEIKHTNQLFSETISETENASMIWIHDAMLRGESADDSLFVEDQLHMNRKGYDVWTKEVRTFFELKPL